MTGHPDAQPMSEPHPAVAAILAVMPIDDIGETLTGWRTTDALGYVPGDVGYSADDPPEQGSVWGKPEPLAARYAAAAARAYAEGLRNRDQGTCGCGCDCSNWLEQQADEIEEAHRG